MAETTKKYSVTCPGCNHEWEHEAEPEALADGGDLIECPNCYIEWEWDLGADGSLTLIDEDASDEDEDEDGEFDDDDEDDEGADED